VDEGPFLEALRRGLRARLGAVGDGAGPARSSSSPGRRRWPEAELQHARLATLA
jgi:hypothetical protein